MGVLALPATAIRRVNAGLIVGNPVGSTNTRAKALTSAELKAIIEASGISYLPLSGGTLTGALSLGENALTCGAITTSGNLAIRNGLTAMKAEVFGTYTSDTAFESLCFKATASAMQIGSAKGSAGGDNRPVQLGHFDAAGTFTSGLSVETNGDVTSVGNITLSGTRQLRLFSGSNYFSGSSTNLLVRCHTTMSIAPAGTTTYTFSGTSLTMSANLISVPPSSVTLATNGQFSVEMTSDTAGNLVYRGSDGTTRRMALTFS